MSRKFFIHNSFRSHFAAAETMASPQQQQNSRVSFVRRIAIMHDKLNDAIEIVNYSFSCGVSVCLAPHLIQGPDLLSLFAPAVAWHGVRTSNDNLHGLQHLSCAHDSQHGECYSINC